MPTTPITPAPPTHHRPRIALWIVLGLVLGLVATGVTLVVVGGRAFIGLFTGAGQTTVTESTVVRSIQNLRRLETVVYTFDQVVTEEREGIVPQPFAGERILLIAHGEVVAGVDLATLGRDAVRVDGRSVRVRLPEPQVFSTRVDNSKTRVYSRDTGLFSNPDPQLETRVRRRAEAQLTEAALREGILDTARENARQTLIALLTSLQFEQVTIE